MANYTIISPVRNEEEFIEKTIKSVVNQTYTPHEWIIVNDGSTDRTAEIVSKYLEKYKWMKMVDQEDRGFYFPGTGVVNTFYKGYDNISKQDWDFIVKLDCDLSFEPDYFENILGEFAKNPKLGLASGLPLIPKNGQMVPEKVQSDHPVGPSKVYRRKCFEEINGLKPIPGWDLADLLASQMKGWETQCFDKYLIEHYRITGSRRKGITGGKYVLGRFMYRFGYSFIYILFKAIYRIFEKPMILGSLSLLYGFFYALVTREKRLYDKDMRKFLRKRHRKFLKQKITGKFSS